MIVVVHKGILRRNHILGWSGNSDFVKQLGKVWAKWRLINTFQLTSIDNNINSTRLNFK